MRLRRRTSQASAGLVVAGLHLGGLLVWWTTDRDMHLVHADARLTSIAVWVPALPTLAVRQAQPKTRSQPTSPGRSGLPRQRDNGTEEPTQTLDAPTASASDGISQPAQAPIAPALNLNLSRQTIASVAPPSFAERSPFHGRLPATVERQIAAVAAEAGPWAEERIDNDHFRLRRGNTCIMMQRPRAASIDPFSEAAARIPWRANVEQCSD